jgi:DNA invertase Pin-like site-specific DNA recombinase
MIAKTQVSHAAGVLAYVEAETGKGADALDRRPQLAAALAAARSAKCSVVVSKLDRLSRDVAFVSGLMAQRVHSSWPNWAGMPILSCCTSTRPWPRKNAG